MTTERRSGRKRADPDLGILAARLLFGLQGELYRQVSERGFEGLRPRHGAVMAYLDEEGIRLGDIAELAGRRKQTIAAILDELERLGYLYRAPHPEDRRAKLIMPTDRGRALMRASDEIVADIERQYAEVLGAKAYTEFVRSMRVLTERR